SVAPSRLDQRLRAEEQTAGLRAAQEFAAAVDDQVGAAHQPRARPLDVLGSRIDHDRNAARLDDGGDLFEPYLRQVLLLAEQNDHRHRFGECRVEVLAGLDFDDPAADHPHRLVIGKALTSGDNYPVDHAVGERQAQHLYGIVASHTRRRAERHRCRAAAGDETPLGAGQLGDAPPGGLHQLVEVDKPAGGLGHRVPHLRQHQAAAMHGAHTATVDEWPYSESEIRIGVSFHEAPPAALGCTIAAYDAAAPRVC